MLFHSRLKSLQSEFGPFQSILGPYESGLPKKKKPCAGDTKKKKLKAKKEKTPPEEELPWLRLAGESSWLGCNQRRHRNRVDGSQPARHACLHQSGRLHLCLAASLRPWHVQGLGLSGHTGVGCCLRTASLVEWILPDADCQYGPH